MPLALSTNVCLPVDRPQPNAYQSNIDALIAENNRLLSENKKLNRASDANKAQYEVMSEQLNERIAALEAAEKNKGVDKEKEKVERTTPETSVGASGEEDFIGEEAKPTSGPEVDWEVKKATTAQRKKAHAQRSRDRGFDRRRKYDEGFGIASKGPNDEDTLDWFGWGRFYGEQQSEQDVKVVEVAAEPSPRLTVWYSPPMSKGYLHATELAAELAGVRKEKEILTAELEALRQKVTASSHTDTFDGVVEDLLQTTNDRGIVENSRLAGLLHQYVEVQGVAEREQKNKNVCEKFLYAMRKDLSYLQSALEVFCSTTPMAANAQTYQNQLQELESLVARYAEIRPGIHMTMEAARTEMEQRYAALRQQNAHQTQQRNLEILQLVRKQKQALGEEMKLLDVEMASRVGLVEHQLKREAITQQLASFENCEKKILATAAVGGEACVWSDSESVSGWVHAVQEASDILSIASDSCPSELE